MSRFQLILLILFGAFTLIAVIVFSASRGGGTVVPNIVVWGEISSLDFNNLVNASSLHDNSVSIIQYIEKSKETFDTDFTEALALGTGPDLIIIDQTRFFKQKNKLLPIPYSSISQKDFTTTFIEEGELFFDVDGIYALPLVVDPLVLYWNRDLFSKSAIALPPSFWDEIYNYAQKLTEKDNAGNIVKSAIALGEARNIPNSKDILALLMLQAGTPITSLTNFGLRAELTNNFNLPIAPARAALDFYTQFSNPAKAFYSWNRSLRSAETAFASGDSAMYVGYASELRNIRAKNPTLNMSIAPVPQSRISNKSLTFGRLSAVAIVKSSRNPTAAFNTALTLVSKDTATSLSSILALPPARRDLLSSRPGDLAQGVFYDSAIQAKGWIDPDSQKTEQIFSTLIESVTSGRARSSEALSTAQDQINALIK